MFTITGIRDGHRILTTVTGDPGRLHFTRRHHPDCPCTTRDQQAPRTTRRRKPTRGAA